MTILVRILVSLPMATGIGLVLSTSAELLEAYKASGQYRERVTPIVESVIETGRAPDLAAEEGFEMQLGLPRARMDRGSYESLRLRLYGGILLTGIGSWIAWRVDMKRRTEDALSRLHRHENDHHPPDQE